MKVYCDFHIHSGLSPCADDNMTPVNIVGFAKLCGLDMIAIADHNAIQNVEVAVKAGIEYGIVVVPAIELQTSEEIHFLCLFENCSKLKKFYQTISLLEIENNTKIYGNQFVFDEDNNIIKEMNNLLLVSSNISSENVQTCVEKFDGVAIPAHIDREANGIVQILGEVPKQFGVVEMSNESLQKDRKLCEKQHKIVVGSDAHKLEDIKKGFQLEIENCSVNALFDWLREKR